MSVCLISNKRCIQRRKPPNVEANEFSRNYQVTHEFSEE